MYKAKILDIDGSIFKVEIPSLNIPSVKANLIIDKGYKPQYSIGDLVIVTELTTEEFIIIGYVYQGV